MKIFESIRATTASLTASIVFSLQGRSLQNIVKLSLGAVISQSIMAVSMLWLSRLYSPESFGVFALYTAVLSVLSALITLRYDLGIVTVKKEGEALCLVWISLLSALVFMLLLLGTAFIQKIYSLELVSHFGLDQFLYLIAFSAFLSSVLAILNSILTRAEAYTAMSASKVAQTVVIVFLGSICGVMGISDGLIYSQVTGVLLATAFLIYVIRIHRFHLPSRNLLVYFSKKHRKYPIYMLPATLIDVITAQLPIPLIAAWYSGEMAGYYSMAWRFLGLPMAIVGGSIATIFFKNYSLVWPNKIASEKLLKKVWASLFLIGIVPTLLAMIYGEIIIKQLLGDDWIITGRIIAIMAPLSFFGFISSATSTTYLVMGMQRYSLYFVISSLIYRPLSLWLGYVSNDIYIGLYIFVACEIMQNITYQAIVIYRLKAK